MIPRSHKTFHYLVLSIILAAHLYGVIIFLPPYPELLNNEPIYNSDYPVHFYQAYAAKKYLAISGKTWGYDPHFMAGYPGNTVYDIGYKLNEIFVCLFSFIGPGRAYKLFVALTFLLSPLMVYLAAKKFELSPNQSLTALLLSVLIWNLDHNFIGIHSRGEGFLCWGMFTFAFACYLSVLLIAVFYRFSRDGKKSDLILLFILGPILISLHLFSAVIIIIPLSITFFFYLLKRRRSYPAVVGLWIAWTLVCNSFWIAPFIRFFHYSQRWAMGTRPISHILMDYIMYRGGLRPLPLLLFFGLLGISTWKSRQKVLKIIYLTSLVFFLIISFFGYTIHEFIASLEPARFAAALKCLLIIPAAIGISLTSDLIRSRVIRWTIFLVILSYLIFAMPSTGRLYSRMPEGILKLISFLRTQTDRSGRILIQDSDPDHPGRYYGAHTIFLPLYMEREQIGGPHYLVPLKHHFAEFSDNIIFGKPISSLGRKEIEPYFDLYNIRWVVVLSASARDWLREMNGYTKEIGKIKLSKTHKIYIYEVLRKPDFFLKGSGMVTADYDRLEISGASKGEIILKYHWLETLKSEPEVKMEPVKLLDDPVPFIRINNPGFSNIVIHN